MLRTLAIFITITAGVSLLMASTIAPARAQAPEVTLILPEDGAVLSEPPGNIHVCFAMPVDNADGADFRFSTINPAGNRLGARIVFQPDGYGVDVMPGPSRDPDEGVWTFEYRVVDDVTKEPTEGMIMFEVAEGGDPPPAEDPERCAGDGSVVQPTGDGDGEPTDAPSDGTDDDDDDDSSLSTAVIVAIVAGSVAAVAVIGGIFALVRGRGGPSSGTPE